MIRRGKMGGPFSSLPIARFEHRLLLRPLGTGSLASPPATEATAAAAGAEAAGAAGEAAGAGAAA